MKARAKYPTHPLGGMGRGGMLRSACGVGTGMTDSSSSSGDGLPESAKYHPGDFIDSKYRLIRPLGAGGTATIWIALTRCSTSRSPSS